MKTETLVGIGVGLLVGWLLWRRRGLLAGGMATSGGCGGGCAGCAGGSSTGTAAGAAPGACAQRLSAGTGVMHYVQQSGPTGQGWGSR